MRNGTIASRPVVAGGGGVLRRLAARLWLYRQIQSERMQLLALTDRELRDIGISRYDAHKEAEKPFWRD